MVDSLLHFYRKGSRPFQTLCDLPEQEALRAMAELYVPGSVFWERFKEPRGYLGLRRQIERTLREGFLIKGGRPVDRCPVYLMLGRPPWVKAAADQRTLETTEAVEVPLSILRPETVSFTYPDSMVSALIAAEGNPEYYEPEYHGQVFTLGEITEIIRSKGLPGEGWTTRMPAHYAHYIEAQVWDRKTLAEHEALTLRRRPAP